jgi:hypothetical protein
MLSQLPRHGKIAGSRIHGNPEGELTRLCRLRNSARDTESRRPGASIDIEKFMRIELDLPPDVFDDQFTAAELNSRVREFAVLELLRAKRLHEHEAQRLLGLERWELLVLMERAGIVATEKVFDQIQYELNQAIARHQPAPAKEPSK